MKHSTKDTIRFYFQYVRKLKKYVFFMFLFLLIGLGADMYWPFVVGNFFEIMTGSVDRKIVLDQLYFLLFQLAIINVTATFGWHVFKLLNLRFEAKGIKHIADDSFLYLQKHSFRFFNNNFSGALVKRLNRLTSSFERIADIFAFDIFKIIIKILVTIVVLSVFSWKLGVVMAFWIGIFITMNIFLANYKYKFDTKKASSDTRVTAEMSDSISNNINLKLFSGLPFEFDRYKKATQNREDLSIRSWKVGTNIDSFQGILFAMLEIGILYIAVNLWSNDLLNVGGLFIIQAYIFELMNSIWGLGGRIRRLFEAFADAEEMIIDLNTKHEIRDKDGAKDLKVNGGKIEFKDVKFKYNKKETAIFDKFNFKVKANQKVALVGPSGGGKTTITKLILRLFDINQGQILIDGQNIKNVTQDSLREAVTLVPQDPYLFHRSLKENIRYGRMDASDQEVYAASKMARCDEFINAMPKKYDTIVGERGVKLSGGQRQRVAIARAILSNAQILIFDEATSSLDSESEKMISDAITNLTKNKTTIIIAHRLSTIMHADKVYVIADGGIAEEGSHAELIASDSGLYKKLWNMQSGGYL